MRLGHVWDWSPVLFARRSFFEHNRNFLSIAAMKQSIGLAKVTNIFSLFYILSLYRCQPGVSVSGESKRKGTGYFLPLSSPAVVN